MDAPFRHMHDLEEVVTTDVTRALAEDLRGGAHGIEPMKITRHETDWGRIARSSRWPYGTGPPGLVGS